MSTIEKCAGRLQLPQVPAFFSAMARQVSPICMVLLSLAQGTFAELHQSDERSSTSTTHWLAICLTVGLGALTFVAMRFLRKPAVAVPHIFEHSPASNSSANPTATVTPAQPVQSDEFVSVVAGSSSRPTQRFEGNFLSVLQKDNEQYCEMKTGIMLPINPTVSDFVHEVARVYHVLPEDVSIWLGGRHCSGSTFRALNGTAEGGAELSRERWSESLSTHSEQGLIQSRVRVGAEFLAHYGSSPSTASLEMYPMVFTLEDGTAIYPPMLPKNPTVRDLLSHLESEYGRNRSQIRFGDKGEITDADLDAKLDVYFSSIVSLSSFPSSSSSSMPTGDNYRVVPRAESL